ncbi:uncharacterized protein [Rutidosis leptorrhynchoides]|uniref:uncharacterized protein n=1 Tax=Rutidosis leptorrhynchoides TaxID=125765 RepID=UPI003A98F2B7
MLSSSGPLRPKGRSGVWVKIVRAGLEIDKKSTSFSNSFIRSIGDGATKAFCSESWLVEKPLKEKFKRLFHLDAAPEALGNRSIPKWCWSRDPNGRVLDELTELNALLSSYIKFDLNMSSDTWIWKYAGNGRFITRELNKFIDESLHNISGTAQMLDKCGIDLHTIICPMCDDDVETLDHAFIFCKATKDLWDRVYKWWGFSSMTNLSINEAFQGKGSRGMSGLESLMWQAAEWTCAYLLWKNRNSKVFSNKSWISPNTLM